MTGNMDCILVLALLLPCTHPAPEPYRRFKRLPPSRSTPAVHRRHRHAQPQPETFPKPATDDCAPNPHSMPQMVTMPVPLCPRTEEPLSRSDTRLNCGSPTGLPLAQGPLDGPHARPANQPVLGPLSQPLCLSSDCLLPTAPASPHRLIVSPLFLASPALRALPPIRPSSPHGPLPHTLASPATPFRAGPSPGEGPECG